MRKLLPVILILIIVYLISSYIYPYEYQRNNFLPDPLYPQKQIINEKLNKKLVILGDSLMAGVGSSDQTKALGYLVGKSVAGELINLATPGSGVEDVLANQLSKAIKEKPDFIIIMIGVNDVHNLKSSSSFADNYAKIVNTLSTETSAKITLVNIPYLGSGKIIFPPWNFLLDLRTRQFNDIILKLRKGKIKVTDLYGESKNKFQNDSNFYSKDQFHPSSVGYFLWATYIIRSLNP